MKRLENEIARYQKLHGVDYSTAYRACTKLFTISDEEVKRYARVHGKSQSDSFRALYSEHLTQKEIEAYASTHGVTHGAAYRAVTSKCPQEAAVKTRQHLEIRDGDKTWVFHEDDLGISIQQYADAVGYSREDAEKIIRRMFESQKKSARKRDGK